MTRLADPTSYFESLGGLHDARVEAFGWSKKSLCLSLRVDDLNSNSLGYPGHVEQAATIVFEGVHDLDAELHIDSSTLSIFDLIAATKGSQINISISFSPSGKMSFDCTNVIVHSDAR